MYYNVTPESVVLKCFLQGEYGMFRFFLLTTLFCIFSTVFSAEDQKQQIAIKSGTILSATISASKPEIQSPYGNQKKPSSFWLEIKIKPDEGRSISIHDYAVLNDGTEIPCIAVAQNNDTYSGTAWKTEKLNSSATARMLFPVPSKDGDYKIRFRLLPTVLPDVKLKTTDAN